MLPGDTREFDGKKSIVVALGVWAERKGKWIEIHMSGDDVNFTNTAVVNNPKSKKRYHRTVFRNLRRLLISHDKWDFGDEGIETEG